jgi:integrase
MSARNSTSQQGSEKPPKPYEGFPLFPHATKRWAKKILGQTRYFGPWDDWQGALDEFNRQKEDLYAGREPAPAGKGVTVKKLCNAFLVAKKQKAARGEITPRMVESYRYTTDRIVEVFGLTKPVADLKPDDFARLLAEMAKTLGPVSRKVEIQKTRSVFKFAADNDLIDRPIRYGSAFDPPDKKALTKAKQKSRQQNGLKMFTADEIRRMMGATTKQFRAMILLGINCGFGNSDCATLTLAALDLENGWHNHPRPKTGVERRCPLWPETVAALKEVIAKRKTPKEPADKDLVFITKHGVRWVRMVDRRWQDSVSSVCKALLGKLGMKQRGRSFYALRHGFETIGGAVRDQVAVDFAMGHSDPSMAGHYREEVDDERLKAVTDHIHDWIFGKNETQ